MVAACFHLACGCWVPVRANEAALKLWVSGRVTEGRVWKHLWSLKHSCVRVGQVLTQTTSRFSWAGGNVLSPGGWDRNQQQPISCPCCLPSAVSLWMHVALCVSDQLGLNYLLIISTWPAAEPSAITTLLKSCDIRVYHKVLSLLWPPAVLIHSACHLGQVAMATLTGNTWWLLHFLFCIYAFSLPVFWLHILPWEEVEMWRPSFFTCLCLIMTVFCSSWQKFFAKWNPKILLITLLITTCRDQIIETKLFPVGHAQIYESSSIIHSFLPPFTVLP